LRPQIFDRIGASEFKGDEVIDLEFRPSPPWNAITREHFPLHFFSDSLAVFVLPRDPARRQFSVREHVLSSLSMDGHHQSQESCEGEPLIQ
jgi:hypothetical protein